jgi:hypothetical protein
MLFSVNKKKLNYNDDLINFNLNNFKKMVKINETDLKFICNYDLKKILLTKKNTLLNEGSDKRRK